ncbi:cysteine desulfurase family protein [Oleisolibacter albus]|uniref:cysteine desulfurase family protein n=1 Tax=Oleisolibacter albus TaxID=2171757 RepID=UPI000DF2F6C0|nr:cysteine desulfurase family protein [Oleisolibacter albus]
MSLYLDWNATAPLRPEARAALLAALDLTGNPSSVHGPGRKARRLVEDARDAVAALVGAPSSWVVFTGSGTEANNLALRVSGMRRRLVLATEHASVLEAAPEAERLPVGPDGLIDLEALRRALSVGAPTLVSVQAANNETGVLQPLPAVAALVRAAGGVLHSDGVQAAGRIPLDLAASGVNLLTVSSHKIGGPQGVGALLVAPQINLDPLVRGGGQERRQRAGTENVAGLAGFGAAAAAARRDLDGYAALAILRDRLEERVLAAAPEAVIFGRAAPRVANTSCIALPGVGAESQLMQFDLAGIAVSSGAACSSGKVKSSHVLRAMGADDGLAASAIRVSLGWSSKGEDIDRFVSTWLSMRARSRRAA